VFVCALLALALVCATLAGCGFHPGGEQIAWQVGDQLWVANPDGSDARQLAGAGVAGFAWSPDHRELAYRSGPNANPAPAGAPWAAAETPSEINVVSISGGTATQITPNNGGLARSDAWWDTQGNRLLYREYGPGAALAAVYYDSQDDQPIGIARKAILDNASLPTLAPDGMRVAVIDPDGNVRVGPPAQTGSVVARGAALILPQTGRPARLLWRPGHDQLLYPTAGNGADATTLRLLDLANGKETTITSLTGLEDASFSPDGESLLLHTTSGLLIWPVGGQAPQGVIADSDPLLQAWWSPNARWLLTADANSLRLYSAAHSWNSQAILTYTTPLTEPQIDAGTAWRPATANPWSPDGTAFVFASPPAGWINTGPPSLHATPAGIYVEQIGANGLSGAPTLIASGNVTTPSWAYLDPSTTLLLPATE
jgi:Tol biopolymer transport system component